MARWMEGIQEAAFKPAQGGGFIFVAPHPWMIGRPRYYAVNDIQKAAIGECLRKRSILVLAFIPIALVVIALFFGMLAYGTLTRVSPILSGVVFAVVLILPIGVIPHIYFMRMAGPILKDVPLSGEKVTSREQVGRMAKAMPKWIIILGLAAGIMMIVGAMMGIYDVVSEGRPAAHWISPIVTMTGGSIFVGWFAYLAMLKSKAAKVS